MKFKIVKSILAFSVFLFAVQSFSEVQLTEDEIKKINRECEAKAKGTIGELGSEQACGFSAQVRGFRQALAACINVKKNKCVRENQATTLAAKDRLAKVRGQMTDDASDGGLLSTHTAGGASYPGFEMNSELDWNKFIDPGIEFSE